MLIKKDSEYFYCQSLLNDCKKRIKDANKIKDVTLKTMVIASLTIVIEVCEFITR